VIYPIGLMKLEDFEYVHDASSRILESNVRLDSMWLFPNTKKWNLDFQLPTQELGLECLIVQAMEGLPCQELFVNNMWNSSNIQIPLVVSKGGEQQLNTFLSQCETPLVISFCLCPLIP
jgi:hypothetical protein